MIFKFFHQEFLVFLKDACIQPLLGCEWLQAARDRENLDKVGSGIFFKCRHFCKLQENVVTCVDCWSHHLQTLVICKTFIVSFRTIGKDDISNREYVEIRTLYTSLSSYSSTTISMTTTTPPMAQQPIFSLTWSQLQHSCTTLPTPW